MAGEVKLVLQHESVEIANYRRSKQLFKFLKRMDVGAESGKPVEISAGDAHRLLRELREVKSNLAPRLARLIKKLNKTREVKKSISALRKQALDRNGNFLPYGCFVKVTFKPACIANEVLFGIYRGVNNRGTAIVEAVLRIENVRLEGDVKKSVTRLPLPKPDVGHVDWDDIEYEPCNELSQLKRKYRVYDTNNNQKGFQIIPPDLDTSGMRRKKKKRKRAMIVKA